MFTLLYFNEKEKKNNQLRIQPVSAKVIYILKTYSHTAVLA
jgi:hypothetical protein